MAVSTLPTSSGPFRGNPNGSVQIDSAGDARGQISLDFQSQRTSPSQVASNFAAVILAGLNNTASGRYATASGYGNTASGYHSLAMGEGNTVSAHFSHAFGWLNVVDASTGMATAFGSHNTVSGNYAFATGTHHTVLGNRAFVSGKECSAAGEGATASGYKSSADGTWSSASGYYASASGYYSHATGRGTIAQGRGSTASGSYCTASGDYSTASGSYSKTAQIGQWAVAAGSFANVKGECQASTYVMRCISTSEFAKPMTFDNLNLRWFLESDKFYGFTIQIMGVKVDGTESAHFIRRGMVSNLSGVVALVGSIETVGTDIKSAGASAWDVSVYASLTGSLEIDATGDAATTIRWISRIETVEIGMPPGSE